MSRSTRRINRKAASHLKAQTLTKGAATRARKELGRSFRLSPPGFTVSIPLPADPPENDG